MAVLMGNFACYILEAMIEINLIRYSGKIIWLKFSSTNHNPAVILRYYLEAVVDDK